MTSLLLLLAALPFTSSFAFGDAGGSAELINGRLRIQFRFKSSQSTPAHLLRPILEKHGYKNDNGFVRTKEDLSPLELENYLYEDGKYVFTLYLPPTEKFYGSFDKKGFVAFEGAAAQKLFEVVKLHVPRNEKNNYLEQYMWADTGYCDKSLNEQPAQYRCWIDM